MASAFIEHDIEAQHNVSQPRGESETYGMSVILSQSETKSDATQEPLMSANQNNAEAQSVISQDEGHRRNEIHEVDIHQSEHDATTRPVSTRVGQDNILSEARILAEPKIGSKNLVVNNSPPVDAAGSPDQEPEEKRMIGDFDGSANALWTLYGKEAKSYDNARIQTLKHDMDGVLIFAGLYSAALTAFIVDIKQNLKVKPEDQMVYYIQQNNAILFQISQQISSIAPQVTIPSTPPPAFPAFNASTSDIRVNAFWFVALIFSLSAALLAILVQQWVRDYMHVFQRYSDPLKSARLRKYLHDGSEGWYMPVVAEAVPGLLHVSLFLFFIGLCDDVLNINTTVGICTTVPICISGLAYIFTIFAPAIYPQSPYQNSFSGLIWFLVQKIRGWRYKDRHPDGASKSVNPSMAQRQMQLAMEETEERKGRDEQAIRWLAGNLTEDAEMELFVMAIPGSFNTEWGVEVWKKVSKPMEHENTSRRHNGSIVGPVRDMNPATAAPSRSRTVHNVFGLIIHLIRPHTTNDSPTAPLLAPHPRNVHLPSTIPPIRENAVGDLSIRVLHLLETCKNRSLFAEHELWRKRTRACIQTTVSLICCADAKLDWFGDITKLLGEIGRDQKIRVASLEGIDQSFVMHWTCLSLMAIRSILEGSWLEEDAGYAVNLLGGDFSAGHELALTRAQEIDETLEEACGYLEELYSAIDQEEHLTEGQVMAILREYEPQISELERINTEADSHKQLDRWLFHIESRIGTDSHGIITHQLPGVQFNPHADRVQFSQAVDWYRDPFKLQFILPAQNLKSIGSLASIFQNILDGHWDADIFQGTYKSLEAFMRVPNWQPRLFQRQLWRLEDLRDGGGLGFIVQLFFLALKQLLSTSSSHSALFIGTFRSITTDWNKYKDSRGTQILLLDMVASYDGIISSFDYPSYITDELLMLLSNILKGQTGQHINEAEQQLELHRQLEKRARHQVWWAKVLRVITEARA